MPIQDQALLPVADPPVVIPIGPHEFKVYLGATENGRRLVDLVEVTPPLPYLPYKGWTRLLLVLGTLLSLEGVQVGSLSKDRFMGIKDGMVA